MYMLFKILIYEIHVRVSVIKTGQEMDLSYLLKTEHKFSVSRGHFLRLSLIH